MDISPEEIQEESCSCVPQIDPYQEIHSGVICIGVANCILEEELYILLDDAIVELITHKSIDLRKEPDFISETKAQPVRWNG